MMKRIKKKILVLDKKYCSYFCAFRSNTIDDEEICILFGGFLKLSNKKKRGHYRTYYCQPECIKLKKEI